MVAYHHLHLILSDQTEHKVSSASQLASYPGTRLLASPLNCHGRAVSDEYIIMREAFFLLVVTVVVGVVVVWVVVTVVVVVVLTVMVGGW